ncbi:uncharacterized protein M6B38_415275 [Iris pallida]|uniref:Uncharacterized protein n=1 Tax=Iris pallida TaxID=29817 RepID=A0AAX6FK80_IRIPA|nr:uncharacterized protein M6B38_415275 [Iris pallida]
MGLCTSCEAAPTVGPAAPTVKVVMEDGTLREFDRPVRPGTAVIGRSDRWFVCDADGMEFDEFVSAVGSDRWLLPGRIYFVLPRTMLKSRLRAEELAKLAVKASSALSKRSSGKCGKRSVAPLVFSSNEEDAAMAVPASGGGRGRKFASELTAIPE